MARTTPKTGTGIVTQEERDHEFRLAVLRWSVGKTVLMTIAISAAIVAGIYLGITVPIRESAGKETTISYALKWIQDWKLGTKFAWGGGAAMGGWAVLERKRRLKERGEKDARISALESQLDPNRTSSELDVSGKKKKKGQ